MGRQTLKKELYSENGIGRDEIKDCENHEEYKSQRAKLLKPGALKLEGNDFSTTENLINPCYQGKGHPGNSSF